MVPHSGPFVLVLSVTLLGSLHTVSLNRDGGKPSWAYKNPVTELTDHKEPGSQWTTQTSRAKMDATNLPMTNSLFSDLTINSEKNSNAPKDLGEVRASNPNRRRSISLANRFSSTTWTDNINSFKTDTTTDTPSKTWSVTQGNEWIPVTSHSDLVDSHYSNFARSLGTTLVVGLRPSRSQVKTTDIGPPEYTGTPEFTHFPMPQTSPDQRRVETRLSADWTLEKSKTTSQRVNVEEFSNSADLGKRRKDLPTTMHDNGGVEDEVSKKSPHETAIVTNTPKGLSALDNNDFAELSSQPDCNLDTTGVCNSSHPLLSPDLPDNNLPSDLSPASPMPPPNGDMTPPPVALTPPMLVPLLSDWNAAMATWGLAWELHVYGLGCVFSLVAALSAFSLLCLPLCWPSGCAHFSLLHLLQLLAGSSRALWLLYDPYGQRDRLPMAWSRLLHEATYPCLTAAFGLLLLLLSGRSRAQLLSQTTLRRCGCLLAALVLVHVAVVMGSVAILRLFPALPVVSLLPPTAFFLLASLLSFSYLLFYCCARTDAKHIYRLNEMSPDHPASHCPLAEAGVWERAAGTGLFSALFLLACGGLRLYAVLHATGLTDEETVGLMPWPWWGFQLSCRVCEAGMCLTLALVVTHPLLCCGGAVPKFGRWSSVFNRQRSSTGGATAATKTTILSSGWSKRPGEKLSLRDGMVRDESESVPLYTLAEVPLCESDGLDLHYPSSPQNQAAPQLSGATMDAQVVSQRSSLASLNGDSTVDLRPPSPIDLRRSIDEALNSEALFRRSLFSSSRLSLSTRGPPDGQPCRGTSTEPVLYRTASCGDVDSPCRNGNSSSLCGGPRGHGGQATNYSDFTSRRQSSQSSLPRGSLPRVQSGRPSQKQYKVLSSTMSRESIYEKEHAYTQADELAVQAEFISVCRQIDALSISSDTIEL
ncbi:proline-rich transmembrane protein 4 [Pygocentrus nattereri]|uniref:proline-rich transmembrane protein 4 n=1 Tax=Pygocentrus nattereri TaxID=42514 RepID=UPI001891AC06|nr:proline-rich transmembrane protein 4 [Pygocentrus nattereri]